MAKDRTKDFDTINDGSHAIRKFTFGDFLIILILLTQYLNVYFCRVMAQTPARPERG